jgi:integrase
VRESKTDAGRRTIELLPQLRDDLATHKARQPRFEAENFVFPTLAGSRQNASNIRNRILASAVARANEHLVEISEPPLPIGLTPHKLRHTYASILVALGVDPGAVIDELGHTDPAFTLRVYRHGMRRDPAARARLRSLVGAADWAPMGTNADAGMLAAVSWHAADPPEGPPLQAQSQARPAGFEPATSRSGGERSIP